MKRFMFCLLLPLLFTNACSKDKAAKGAAGPYSASKSMQQEEARDRVAARGRYDVAHDPNDTFSINSMGSD